MTLGIFISNNHLNVQSDSKRINMKSKPNGVSNGLTMNLMKFDCWGLLKVKKLIKLFLRKARPILEAVFFIGLGIGCILIYIFTQMEFQNSSHNRIQGNTLALTDSSEIDSTNFQKELFILKNKAFHLEAIIRKMNIELQKHYLQKSITDQAKPDFASEAAGGAIIDTPETQTYQQTDKNQLSIFGIPIWKPNYFTPRKIIQPWSQLGECWAFRGAYGKIEIELAYTITISHVTMEHIPQSASLTGKIDSAPKKFALLGRFRNKYITIDTFVYNINGPSVQTFSIKREDVKHTPFKRVILEVLSNWGYPAYTCIYRFRVHGKIFSILEKKSIQDEI